MLEQSDASKDSKKRTASCRSPSSTSPGLLDNNPEQIRNKLKISAYVLETT